MLALADDSRARRALRHGALTIGAALAVATAPTAQCLRTPNAGPGTIYWTDLDGRAIVLANLDGSNPRTVVTGAGGLLDIDVDVANGKMYWTNDRLPPSAAGGVWRADLDGSNAQQLVPTIPAFVAVDPTRGNLYWTDGTLVRANLDGSAAQTIATGGNIQGLASDRTTGKVYWSDVGTGTIHAADFDGANAQVIVNNAPEAFSLVIDELHRTIYWGDFQTRLVERANLDGSGRQPILTIPAGSSPGALAIDPRLGHLYLTGPATTGMFRTDLDGNDLVELFPTGVLPVAGVANPGSPPALYGDFADICLATGGTQDLRLDAGPGESGQTYVVLGSASGTLPGFQYQGRTIPLNVDGYLSSTLATPVGPPLFGELGTLDGQGLARANVTIPAGLGFLAGLSLDHAFVVLDGNAQLRFVSNAVRVTFVP